MKYDIIFKNANLYQGKGKLLCGMDMGIKDGIISSVSKTIDEAEGNRVIDATGCMISPGFVDSHMHIDLNYTFDYKLDVPSLIGGAKQFLSIFYDSYYKTRQEMFDDITRRSAKTIDNCIINGTTALKTNVTYLKPWKGLSLDSILYLKDKYKELCDVFILTTFTHPEPDAVFENEVAPEWEKAAKDGKVDFIAAYPHKHPDGRQIIDSVFAKSKEYGLPIDMHCDESDVPVLDCFSYILDKTIETNMQGKVTLGHVTALASHFFGDDEAAELIKRAALADVNITTLTSCNLYLMNMNRRGPTRVKELVNAGVNVAVASDDVREVLRPYGNCDLLEEALLTAKVHQMGSSKELRQVFDMISYNAARNCLMENYGVDEGCKADLVVLNAPTPEQAILDQCSKPYVLKAGSVVARNGKLC